MEPVEKNLESLNFNKKTLGRFNRNEMYKTKGSAAAHQPSISLKLKPALVQKKTE